MTDINKSFTSMLGKLFWVHRGVRFKVVTNGWMHNGVLCGTEKEMDWYIDSMCEKLGNTLSK